MQSVKFAYGNLRYSPDNVTPMVDHLLQHPDEIGTYQKEMMGVIANMLEHNDFKHPIVAVTVICKVLVDVNQRLGKPVLAPMPTAN